MSLEGTFTPQNFWLLLVTKVRDRKKIVFNLKNMAKKYSDEELSEIISQLISYSKKNDDFIEKFIEKNFETHNKSIELSWMLAKFLNNFIDEYNKRTLDMLKIILFNEIILGWIIMYLFFPTFNEILKSLFVFWKNLSEWWQIAIFWVTSSFILWIIWGLIILLLYDKFKMKKSSPQWQ